MLKALRSEMILVGRVSDSNSKYTPTLKVIAA
jgi:hypothetical protein